MDPSLSVFRAYFSVKPLEGVKSYLFGKGFPLYFVEYPNHTGDVFCKSHLCPVFWLFSLLLSPVQCYLLRNITELTKHYYYYYF